MRRFLFTLAMVAVLAAAAAPASLRAQRRNARPAAPTAAAAATSAQLGADQIRAEDLSAYLHFVASDAMEGRNTPSRGLDVTAQFLAMNMRRWGIKPAGEGGTYFQKIKLRQNKVNPSQSYVQVGEQRFAYGEGFLRAQGEGTATGPVVYAGHGWVIKAKNINAYEGVDVRGKIMVVQGGLPKGVTFADFASGKHGEDWLDPLTYAQRNGAIAGIVLPSFQALTNWETSRLNEIEHPPISVDAFISPTEAQQAPAVLASLHMVNALFAGEKMNGAEVFRRRIADDPGASFALSPDKKVTISVSATPSNVETQNVIGVLEGSDPVLKNEYVAIGAHYDHVGIGTPVNGDAIYNGADDDGSGTVGVLSIAEAFAKTGTRPKRSILFVWHAGEEKGLWGSRYFVEHPTVPLDKIVAQLNIDMIGRSRRDGDTNPRNKELSGPNEIYVIGSKMMSTELGELSERINTGYVKLNFNYKYDDPQDPNRFFFRSDHFHYARKGVPIIFYFDGEHEDYHRPGDHPDKIDYQKMEKVVRTVYATAREIANMASRLRVDKQLPPGLTGNN